MSVIVSSAPVAFGSLTTAAGTAAQVIPVNAAGVLAGLPAGNFFLDSPQSNTLNGRRFVVSASGWILAHGASQTVAVGLQAFPWNTSVAGARTASGTATFTPVASATLTAATYYNFVISQTFFASLPANTMSCLPPTVNVAGAAVSISTVPAAIVTAITIASQTEPITGINNTINYPLVSFAVSVTNSVSDAVETVQLTQFSIDLV